MAVSSLSLEHESKQLTRPTKIFDWDKYENSGQKKKWHRGTEGLMGIAGHLIRTREKRNMVL